MTEKLYGIWIQCKTRGKFWWEDHGLVYHHSHIGIVSAQCVNLQNLDMYKSKSLSVCEIGKDGMPINA